MGGGGLWRERMGEDIDYSIKCLIISRLEWNLLVPQIKTNRNGKLMNSNRLSNRKILRFQNCLKKINNLKLWMQQELMPI